MISLKSLPRRQGSRSDGSLAKIDTEQFKTNKFKIIFDQKKSIIYQYDYKLMIDGNTQVAKDSQLYYKIVKELKKQLVDILGFEMHRGQIIYCTKKQPLTTLKCQYDQNGKKLHLEANFKQVKEINLKDIINGNLTSQETQHIFQMLNIKLKNQLRDAGMIQLGRSGKYFKKDPKPFLISAGQDRGNNRDRNRDNQEDDSFKLLEGYKFTIVQTQRQFALQIDTCFRVLQNESFKNQIQRQLRNMAPAEISTFFSEKTVTANYGNYKNYKIIGIDFNKNPRSTFVQDNNIEISFMDYYWKNYKIKIEDQRQPLIKVILRTDKKIGIDGKIKKTQIEGYLIPELVSLAGIKDTQASNVRLMRKLAQYTKLTPQIRLSGCQKAIHQINKQESFMQITKPINQKGYALALPTLSYQKDTCKPDEKGTIKKLCRLRNTGKFDQYLFVYSIGRNQREQNQDRDQADRLIDSIKSSSKIYGVEFKKPAYLQVNGNDAQTWIEAIRKDCQQSGNPQIIILFLNWKEEKIYSKLKQFCINELKCPSQCIRRKTFQNPKAVRSASSKLVIQMNVKIGCAAWKVNKQHPYFKNRKLMYGGLTVSKGSNGSYLSFVGSIDDDQTQFYSACKRIPKFENISQECFEQIFKQWAKNFCKANKAAPDTIIIYRQGLNEKQAQSQISTIQFPALCKTLQVIQTNMKLKNYRPQCQICIVNKKINSRFFSMVNGKIDNPMSGSFTIQDKESDTFLLVPQYVTQGTSTPTKVKIAIDCSNIPIEALVTFTYQQCFNYYNWQGAVRVPSALQFANKLGKLVSEHIKQDVTKSSLSSLLYFL